MNGVHDVHGNPMPRNIYEKNSTMQLLGEQYFHIFWGNDSARKSVDEIAEARPCSFTPDAAADLFMLGYIYGKRAERAKRKAMG